MSDNVLITPASRKIEFFDSAANVDAKIETDSSGNLLITNTGGDISIGDTSSDIFVGDGTNSIDIIFEQSGEIRGLTGVTLTLGQSDSNVQMATDLDLNTNDIINVNNLTVGGYLAGPSTFTIDPAGVGDNTGTVVIAGNLQVDGTTTTINSTTVTVDDLNLTLASGAANAAAANGAGLTVDGANATITYDSSNDEWDFNKNINITGNLILSGTVDGRDVAADGTKLDGIEAGATADQTLGDLGITATAAEINKLDGVTATTAELNYIDGVTSNIQTQLNGKLSTTGVAAQATNLNATDDRDIAPEDLSYSDDLRIYFADKGGLETGTIGSNYQDVLVLNSYSDSSGGDANALAFDKSEKKIYHYQADQSATNWGTAKTLAYTDDISLSTLSITATAAEINKLDGVTATTTELNHTDGVTSNIQTQLDAKLNSSSYTASDVLTKIKTVDGSGSGLDADLLDGIEAAAITQSGDSVALTGDVTGSTTVGADGAISVATTIAANSVALGTDTTGNYIATVAGTANEIEVSGSGSETAAVTVGLPSAVQITTSLTVGGNSVLTTANEGSGNGIDADTVDGIEGASFLRSDAADTATGNLTFDGTVTIDQQIIHKGDTNTYIEYHAADSFRVVTGGTERLEVTNSGVRFSDAFTLPTSDGSANQVLTTDGSGTVTWADGGSSSSARTEAFPTVTNGSANVTMAASYTLAQIDVYLNGARMKGGTDYSVSGTTLTFSENLTTGDVVALYAYDTAQNLITGNWSDLNDVSVTGAATNTMVRFDGSNYVAASTTEDSSGNLSVSGNATLTGDLTVSGGQVIMPTVATRDKYRVWNTSTYAIGMANAISFGGLNDYAMTFQFSNNDARGFWFGDSGHNDAQGAMALTTNGKLTVAHSARIGHGETDTTTPGATHALDVNGSVSSTAGTNVRTFIATNGTQYVSLVSDLTDGGYNPISAAGDVGIIFTTDNDNTTDESGKGLVIAPWAQTAAKGIKIQEDGKVGVGTSSPSTELEVNGTITDDVGDVRIPRWTAISTATTIANEGVYYCTGAPTVTLGSPAVGTIMTIYNNNNSAMTLNRGSGSIAFMRKGADNDQVNHTSATLGGNSTTTVTIFNSNFAVVTGTDVT